MGQNCVSVGLRSASSGIAHCAVAEFLEAGGCTVMQNRVLHSAVTDTFRLLQCFRNPTMVCSYHKVKDKTYFDHISFTAFDIKLHPLSTPLLEAMQTPESTGAMPFTREALPECILRTLCEGDADVVAELVLCIYVFGMDGGGVDALFGTSFNRTKTVSAGMRARVHALLGWKGRRVRVTAADAATVAKGLYRGLLVVLILRCNQRIAECAGMVAKGAMTDLCSTLSCLTLGDWFAKATAKIVCGEFASALEVPEAEYPKDDLVLAGDTFEALRESEKHPLIEDVILTAWQSVGKRSVCSHTRAVEEVAAFERAVLRPDMRLVAVFDTSPLSEVSRERQAGLLDIPLDTKILPLSRRGYKGYDIHADVSFRDVHNEIARHGSIKHADGFAESGTSSPGVVAMQALGGKVPGHGHGSHGSSQSNPMEATFGISRRPSTSNVEGSPDGSVQRAVNAEELRLDSSWMGRSVSQNVQNGNPRSQSQSLSHRDMSVSGRSQGSNPISEVFSGSWKPSKLSQSDRRSQEGGERPGGGVSLENSPGVPLMPDNGEGGLPTGRRLMLTVGSDESGDVKTEKKEPEWWQRDTYVQDWVRNGDDGVRWNARGESHGLYGRGDQHPAPREELDRREAWFAQITPQQWTRETGHVGSWWQKRPYVQDYQNNGEGGGRWLAADERSGFDGKGRDFPASPSEMLRRKKWYRNGEDDSGSESSDEPTLWWQRQRYVDDWRNNGPEGTRWNAIDETAGTAGTAQTFPAPHAEQLRRNTWYLENIPVVTGSTRVSHPSHTPTDPSSPKPMADATPHTNISGSAIETQWGALSEMSDSDVKDAPPSRIEEDVPRVQLQIEAPETHSHRIAHRMPPGVMPLQPSLPYTPSVSASVSASLPETGTGTETTQSERDDVAVTSSGKQPPVIVGGGEGATEGMPDQAGWLRRGVQGEDSGSGRGEAEGPHPNTYPAVTDTLTVSSSVPKTTKETGGATSDPSFGISSSVPKTASEVLSDPSLYVSSSTAHRQSTAEPTGDVTRSNQRLGVSSHNTDVMRSKQYLGAPSSATDVTYNATHHPNIESIVVSSADTDGTDVTHSQHRVGRSHGGTATHIPKIESIVSSADTSTEDPPPEAEGLLASDIPAARESTHHLHARPGALPWGHDVGAETGSTDAAVSATQPHLEGSRYGSDISASSLASRQPPSPCDAPVSLLNATPPMESTPQMQHRVAWGGSGTVAEEVVEAEVEEEEEGGDATQNATLPLEDTAEVSRVSGVRGGGEEDGTPPPPPVDASGVSLSVLTASDPTLFGDETPSVRPPAEGTFISATLHSTFVSLDSNSSVSVTPQKEKEKVKDRVRRAVSDGTVTHFSEGGDGTTSASPRDLANPDTIALSDSDSSSLSLHTEGPVAADDPAVASGKAHLLQGAGREPGWSHGEGASDGSEESLWSRDGEGEDDRPVSPALSSPLSVAVNGAQKGQEGEGTVSLGLSDNARKVGQESQESQEEEGPVAELDAPEVAVGQRNLLQGAACEPGWSHGEHASNASEGSLWSDNGKAEDDEPVSPALSSPLENFGLPSSHDPMPMLSPATSRRSSVEQSFQGASHSNTNSTLLDSKDANYPGASTVEEDEPIDGPRDITMTLHDNPPDGDVAETTGSPTNRHFISTRGETTRVLDSVLNSVLTDSSEHIPHSICTTEDAPNCAASALCETFPDLTDDEEEEEEEEYDDYNAVDRSHFAVTCDLSGTVQDSPSFDTTPPDGATVSHMSPLPRGAASTSFKEPDTPNIADPFASDDLHNSGTPPLDKTLFGTRDGYQLHNAHQNPFKDEPLEHAFCVDAEVRDAFTSKVDDIWRAKEGSILDELQDNLVCDAMFYETGEGKIDRIRALCLRLRAAHGRDYPEMCLLELLALHLYTLSGADIDAVMGFPDVPSYGVTPEEVQAWNAYSAHNKAMFREANWCMRAAMEDAELQMREGDAVHFNDDMVCWATLQRCVKFIVLIMAVARDTRPKLVSGKEIKRAFRGITGLPDTALDRHAALQKKETLCWPGASSCAVDPSVSVNYIRGSTANATAAAVRTEQSTTHDTDADTDDTRPTAILFKVARVNHGVPLSHISKYPAETEILLPPLADVQVTKVFSAADVDSTIEGPYAEMTLKLQDLGSDQLEALCKAAREEAAVASSWLEGLLQEPEPIPAAGDTLTYSSDLGEAVGRQESEGLSEEDHLSVGVPVRDAQRDDRYRAETSGTTVEEGFGYVHKGGEESGADFVIPMSAVRRGFQSSWLDASAKGSAFRSILIGAAGMVTPNAYGDFEDFVSKICSHLSMERSLIHDEAGISGVRMSKTVEGSPKRGSKASSVGSCESCVWCEDEYELAMLLSERLGVFVDTFASFDAPKQAQAQEETFVKTQPTGGVLVASEYLSGNAVAMTRDEVDHAGRYGILELSTATQGSRHHSAPRHGTAPDNTPGTVPDYGTAVTPELCDDIVSYVLYTGAEVEALTAQTADPFALYWVSLVTTDAPSAVYPLEQSAPHQSKQEALPKFFSEVVTVLDEAISDPTVVSYARRRSQAWFGGQHFCSRQFIHAVMRPLRAWYESVTSSMIPFLSNRRYNAQLGASFTHRLTSAEQWHYFILIMTCAASDKKDKASAARASAWLIHVTRAVAAVARDGEDALLHTLFEAKAVYLFISLTTWGVARGRSKTRITLTDSLAALFMMFAKDPRSGSMLTTSSTFMLLLAAFCKRILQTQPCGHAAMCVLKMLERLLLHRAEYGLCRIAPQIPQEVILEVLSKQTPAHTSHRMVCLRLLCYGYAAYKGRDAFRTIAPRVCEQIFHPTPEIVSEIGCAFGALIAVYCDKATVFETVISSGLVASLIDLAFCDKGLRASALKAVVHLCRASPLICEALGDVLHKRGHSLRGPFAKALSAGDILALVHIVAEWTRDCPTQGRRVQEVELPRIKPPHLPQSAVAGDLLKSKHVDPVARPASSRKQRVEMSLPKEHNTVSGTASQPQTSVATRRVTVSMAPRTLGVE